MKRKDLFLGGGILFAACVLFLVMNLMQYVQAKESGQKENQEKQLAKFVGLGFLSERVLNTLLKTTQKNGMKIATSYILEMQQKSSKEIFTTVSGLRMEKLTWKRLTVRMDIAKSRGRSITGHRQLSACLTSWLWK